jgi:hypothetical protein
MPDLIKQLFWLVGAVPTAILFIRGFTLTIRQGTEEAGSMITDYAALFVFWLLVVVFLIWLLLTVSRNIYERYMGKKGQSVFSVGKLGEKSDDEISVNININSNDFINKDAKQVETFFTGVSNIIRESGNAKKQPNSKAGAKETKSKA